MKEFFIFALLITVLIINSNSSKENFKSCKKKLIYYCNINRHLRRKCTWLSPCYYR